MSRSVDPEWAENWRPLLGCWVGMGIGIHSLALYTQSIFFPSLEAAFGWDRTYLSLGPTILVVSLAIASPFAGALLDRGPVRLLTCASAVAIAAGFLGLARMNGSIISFYVILCLMAIAGAACSTLAFSRVVNSQFDRRRGTALGLAMTGTGAAATLSPIIVANIIASEGWRAGYSLLAAVTMCAVPLLMLLLPAQSTRADSNPAVPAGDRTENCGMLAVLWKLAVAFTLVPLAVSGLLAHFVPMLVDSGMTLREASMYAAVVGLTVAIARLVTGLLVDRFFAPWIAFSLFALSAAGLLLFVFLGTTFAFLGALAVGLSIGAEIDLIGYLTARYFGMRQYGRIYGWLYSACLVGTALSPLIYGLGHDVLGSYTPTIIGAAFVLAGTAVLFARLPAYPRRGDAH